MIEKDGRDLGRMVEFTRDVTCSMDMRHGYLKFGNISINTGDDGFEEEEG